MAISTTFFSLSYVQFYYATLSRFSAKFWAIVGVILVVTIIGCKADTGSTQGDTDEPMDRQSRGLLLRSWRNAQNKQQQQEQDAAESQENKKLTENNILSPGPLHRDLTSHILAGMSAPMRLVLLQRLTGYDKRTPNGKSFLGMRGKKMDPSYQPQEEMGEIEEEPLESSGEDYGFNTYTVPDKKKEKFLGMRGKKATMLNEAANNNNYLLRQLQQMAESKKRVPSSNAFMGVRGKRSN